MSNQKTALVTGANKGIGFATVRGLAKQGYQVWLGARDRGLGERAVEKLRSEGLDVQFLSIDVSNDSSVQQAALILGKQINHLDLLINNAGMGPNMDTSPSVENVESIHKIYQVNVFGPIRVTQALLSLLRSAREARIIMVSSILGSLALGLDDSIIYGQVNMLGYSSSKTALNAVTAAFAKELKAEGIKVYAVEPGNIKTDLNNNTGKLSTDEGAIVPLRYSNLENEAESGGFFGPDGELPW